MALGVITSVTNGTLEHVRLKGEYCNWGLNVAASQRLGVDTYVAEETSALAKEAVGDVRLAVFEHLLQVALVIVESNAFEVLHAEDFGVFD